MPANVETMAYVKESEKDVPWHGLGNPVAKGATVDEMKHAANLDWAVKTAPLTFEIDGVRYNTSDFAMFRGDRPTRVFDTVGPKYVPFQNEEVLEFFREYVEAGDMYIDTAGALLDGQIIWAQAKMNREFTLGTQGDVVRARVLLMNPHQYGKGAKVKLCNERVVCHNTLNMALGEGGGTVNLPHTRVFDETARQDAKRRLGIAKERFEAFEVDAIKLVDTTLTEQDVEDVLVAVFPEQEKVQDSVRSLFLGAGRGSDLLTAKDTGWGLLNAVTEYYDWQSGRDANTRIRGAWDGTGASKKRAAMSILLGKAPTDEEVASN